MGTGIGLKLISELQGMSFVIPNYQRGYRWTEQQVKDLLNDINEFNPQNENNFYCLQPIVVKQRDNEYEVIDGQQRLTTIFLILKYLKGKNLYELKYNTRNDSEKFLSNIDDKNENDAMANIDFYHMWQAYNCIKDWFNKHFPNEEKDEAKTTEDRFKMKLLNRTKFIWYWYESDEEDPIEVFTRLNIGKISLTNAELIKALFLNSSNFTSMEGKKHLRLRQQEIASEWDNIEYTLQNEEFWLFLHDKGYTNPTRIDFIFDLICENDKLGIKDKGIDYDNVIGTDKYRTFRYFYEYFKLKEAKIKYCWAMVKKYYNTFKEWYDDLEFYHYIGFLISQGEKVETLLENWEDKKIKKIVEEDKEKDEHKNCDNEEIKTSFLQYLCDEIKKKINGCKDLNKQYKIDGSDKTNCHPLLLLHNIQTVINQGKNAIEKYGEHIFYKFPFHLYKMEGWDVEHIDSSTENLEDDANTRQEWLVNVYLGVKSKTQEKIEAYFKPDAKGKEDLFKDIQNDLRKLGQEQWTPEEKNKIWNYTLLDSSTNRSYKNAIFSGKRRVIIGKDKGKFLPIPKIIKRENTFKFIKGEEQDADSSFIPPCTKNVFLKYYSSSSPSLNYWYKEDAKAYMNDIYETLKNFDVIKMEDNDNVQQ